MSAAFQWTDATVRDALGLPAAEPGGEEVRFASVSFASVSTDTRTAGPGDLFVALVGERFDAHDFLGEAAARGVGGAVVSREPASTATVTSALPLYRVEDTLVALGALARYRRRRLPARIAAVTGSSGKTTVKDMLAASLTPTFRVHATRGNLNNRVGVPLTLLAAPVDADVVVVEMGTSVPGEIAALTEIAEPDAGIVTTVAEAHLEGLGSLEGVLEEKLALVRGARDGAVLVVGDEPPALPRRARELRPEVRVAGLGEGADPDLRGEVLGTGLDGRKRVRAMGQEVDAGLPGIHGARNLVLALAVAKLMGAPIQGAVRGAASVKGGKLRNEIRRIGELTLLLDCYNANPQSVAAALALLGHLPAPGGRVAFLGSMLELGTQSAALHREALARALALPLDVVVAVGAFAAAAEETEGASATGSTGGGARTGGTVAPRLVVAATPEEGYDALRPFLGGTETVLLKGSRGVALERLVPRFEADFGTPGGGSV